MLLLNTIRDQGMIQRGPMAPSDLTLGGLQGSQLRPLAYSVVGDLDVTHIFAINVSLDIASENFWDGGVLHYPSGLSCFIIICVG